MSINSIGSGYQPISGAAQQTNRSNQTSAQSSSFLSMLKDSVVISSEAAASVKSTSDMTMDEYKQYIYNQISQITIHPSRALESISINISEAGFEAMNNDSDYEAWVLNDLKTGFAVANPWVAQCGGAYTVIQYGATKEECRVEGWYPGYNNGKGESLYNQRSEESFWQKRAARQKLYAQQAEKRSQERLQEERSRERIELESKIYERKMFSRAISE